MRVVALAFALSLLTVGAASAGCWGSNVTADSGKSITTAEAPIQTPTPKTGDSDS